MKKVISSIDEKNKRLNNKFESELTIDEVINNWKPMVGIGKSSILKNFAEQNGIKLIDIKTIF